MDSKGKTLKIIDVLFLLCFFVYAVSPLTYTAQSNTIASADSGGIQTPGVSLYLVTLLLSNVISEDDDDDPGDRETAPSSHCLLIKKRAVLSSKNLKSLMLVQAMEALTLAAVFSTDTATLARTAPQDHSNFYPQYVLPCHSGNSPPSA